MADLCAVDLFAGLGGFTEGAEQAGCSVVWAANHWRAVVETHAANHPRTKHACRDLHQQHGDRFLTAYYGATRGGRSLAKPIGTITTRDRWTLIDGDRMRMLTVPEARRAMSFRDDYVLPASSREAMHMLGNAVPPLAAREVITTLRAAA